MKKHIQGIESIAFAVGGTGGHILPALKIAKNLPGEGKRILVGVGISENPFAIQKQFPRFTVSGNNFSEGYFSGVKSIVKGIGEAKRILRKEQCTHVVGMGGFHSLPVLIAAINLRIPITLYEPNLVSGKVNKVFSLFAKQTLVLFQEVEKTLYGEVKLLTLRTKKEIEKGLPSVQLLRREFGLEEDVTTILVFGGSRGARSINDLLNATLQHIDKKIQVIHLTGVSYKIKEIYEKHGIRSFVTTFFQDMDKAWKACDFAICRAGASSIKEALIFSKPTILIPYPNAVNDHQNHNAIFIENVVKSGRRLLQKDATAKKLSEIIHQFCCDQNLNVMIENINRYISRRKGEHIDNFLL